MAKDKAIFSALNECNTKEIFVGDDRSLSVVGFGTIQVENGHFNDVLCVPNISCKFLSVYQITHSGEGVVGKNTLRTSKLGSDLHADFDRK
jgi:hypothetical protein